MRRHKKLRTIAIKAETMLSKLNSEVIRLATADRNDRVNVRKRSSSYFMAKVLQQLVSEKEMQEMLRDVLEIKTVISKASVYAL